MLLISATSMSRRGTSRVLTFLFEVTVAYTGAVYFVIPSSISLSDLHLYTTGSGALSRPSLTCVSLGLDRPLTSPQDGHRLSFMFTLTLEIAFLPHPAEQPQSHPVHTKHENMFAGGF